MGISRDKIQNRKPSPRISSPSTYLNPPGIDEKGHAKSRVAFMNGTESATPEQRLELFRGDLELIRGKHSIALHPFFRVWESIWHNLKLLADHTEKRRGKIPEGWATPIAELREILAGRTGAELGLGDEGRTRIEGLLSRIAGKAVDIP